MSNCATAVATVITPTDSQPTVTTTGLANAAIRPPHPPFLPPIPHLVSPLPAMDLAGRLRATVTARSNLDRVRSRILRMSMKMLTARAVEYTFASVGRPHGGLPRGPHCNTRPVGQVRVCRQKFLEKAVILFVEFGVNTQRRPGSTQGDTFRGRKSSGSCWMQDKTRAR